jgi:hypothetical protein
MAALMHCGDEMTADDDEGTYDDDDDAEGSSEEEEEDDEDAEVGEEYAADDADGGRRPRRDAAARARMRSIGATAGSGNGNDGASGTSRVRRELGGVVDEKSVDDEWQVCELAFVFARSLSQLAADPGASVITLDKDINGVFRRTKADAAASSERTRNHILGGMELVSFKNGFDCTLTMAVDTKTDSNYRFTSSGAAGVYTFFPRSHAFFSPRERPQLVRGGANADMRFLKKYPGRNLDNIDEGITHVTQDWSLVRSDHPCVTLFNNQLVRRGDAPLGKADEGTTPDHYTLPRKETESCLKGLREKMQDRLKITDLYALGLRFDRGFVAGKRSSPGAIDNNWLNEMEIFDNVTDEDVRDCAVNEVKSLYLTVELRYKVV